MSEQSNRFAPLQESVEDDEDDAQDGWDDVISIGSNSTDSPLPSSHARGITSKRLRPIHKKKQKAKPHSRRTLYTGKALSDQEITFLSGSYAPTSLQQAAIKVGFPSRAGSFGREGEMSTRSKSSKPDISQASLAGVPSTPSASAPTANSSQTLTLPSTNTNPRIISTPSTLPSSTAASSSISRSPPPPWLPQLLPVLLLFLPYFQMTHHPIPQSPRLLFISTDHSSPLATKDGGGQCCRAFSSLGFQFHFFHTKFFRSTL